MRRILVFGIVGTITLFACIGAFIVVSFSSLFMRDKEAETQSVRIVQVAPLKAEGVSNQTVVEAPPGLIPAALEEPAVMPTLPAATATATATASPTASPTPQPTLTPETAPTQTKATNRVVVPKLDLEREVLTSPIVRGTWQVEHLEQAVGHLEGTASPGANSNFVLAGHVDLITGEAGPFARLDQLTPGDLIIVYEGNKEFYYIVDTFYTVEATRVDVTYPSDTGQITLITCTNWSEATGRYVDRLIVKGHLIKI